MILLRRGYGGQGRASLLALALLAGCTLGPRYSAPPTPPAAQGPFVSATPQTFAQAQPPSDWWRLYRDPVLDGLVQEALTHNADLRAAAANLAKARAVLEEARTGLFPQTTTSASATYGNRTASLQGVTTPEARWFYDGTLDVSYEVDLWGRIRRTIEAARADAEAIQAAQDLVRVTVAAETARAYADACAYGEEIAVARRSADTAQEQYELTVKARDLGARSDFDVASAGAIASQARAAIPTVEGQQRAALFDLAVLTGRPPEEISAAAAACHTPPAIGQLLPVGDGAALLRRRPDVRQAERTLAADTARIGVAEADLFPTVSLTGSASQAGANGAQLISSRNFSYALGPLITWSFPDIAPARARVRQSEAQASGDIARFDSAVLNALKEVEQALSAYNAELRRHAELTAARDQSRRAYDLAEVQLQNGAISFPDLLQTERNLLQADADVATSDQALVSDQVTVFKTLGGGWEQAPAVAPPKAP
jgi:NodT family efflux transporter outer membrane factor (OMF) lipoprotein